MFVCPVNLIVNDFIRKQQHATVINWQVKTLISCLYQNLHRAQHFQGKPGPIRGQLLLQDIVCTALVHPGETFAHLAAMVTQRLGPRTQVSVLSDLKRIGECSTSRELSGQGCFRLSMAPCGRLLHLKRKQERLLCASSDIKEIRFNR